MASASARSPNPKICLDLGNSGTSARLLLGILATHPITAFVTGDASLRRRPMGRVVEPLSRFGARFVTREGARLPLAVSGAADPIPILYRLPVPSAQVKSAVLLAGLNTPGTTTVIEPQPTPRPYRAHAAPFRRRRSRPSRRMAADAALRSRVFLNSPRRRSLCRATLLRPLFRWLLR